MISLTHGIFKMSQMNIFTKQKQTPRLESKLIVTKEDSTDVEGVKSEVWGLTYTHYCI